MHGPNFLLFLQGLCPWRSGQLFGTVIANGEILAGNSKCDLRGGPKGPFFASRHAPPQALNYTIKQSL